MPKVKSRAGNTTKIHLAVDGYGLPVELAITGGEKNDYSAAPDLIVRLSDTKAIVAVKGYDGECIREQINEEEGTGCDNEKAQLVEG